MGTHATFVGADVYARSIFCRAVNVATGKTWSKTFAGEGKVISLEEWVRSLPGPAIVGYESGCTGFDMARRLAADGIECEVIAVTTIPKSTKDKAHKCDKLDAAAIVREMANPVRGCSSVWVPSAEEEAARELARLKVRAAEEVKASKQRVACFLIKHGHAWNERTESGNLRKTWTAAYRTWLNSLRLDDPTSELVLNELVAAVDRRMVEDSRIRSLVEKEAEKPRWKPYVDALCRLSGIDVCTAFLAAAEFGSFERFPSGMRVPCWIGTIPRNSSSGEKEAHGGITRDGNSFLRRALVEGCCGMQNRKNTVKGMRDGFVSPAVEAMAHKANERMLGRYRRLVNESGKSIDEANVAIASEMARWIWAVGCQVEREQGASAYS